MVLEDLAVEQVAARQKMIMVWQAWQGVLKQNTLLLQIVIAMSERATGILADSILVRGQLHKFCERQDVLH